MWNNSETDRNKSAQYNVKSLHYKWLLLRACLHGGGGPQISELTGGGLPHLPEVPTSM